MGYIVQTSKNCDIKFSFICKAKGSWMFGNRDNAHMFFSIDEVDKFFKDIQEERRYEHRGSTLVCFPNALLHAASGVDFTNKIGSAEFNVIYVSEYIPETRKIDVKLTFIRRNNND